MKELDRLWVIREVVGAFAAEGCAIVKRMAVLDRRSRLRLAKKYIRLPAGSQGRGRSGVEFRGFLTHHHSGPCSRSHVRRQRSSGIPCREAPLPSS